MRSRIFIILIILLSATAIYGQGIFENSLRTESGSQDYLHGFVRGSWFGSSLESNPVQSKSLYGQAALQISAHSGTWGKAFADIRFRSGNEYQQNLQEIDIRETWVSAGYKFGSLKIGKQIIAWGRADGFNPTDNITPMNYFMRSPEPDDMRMGNWAASLQLQPLDQIRIEIDYLPVYRPSIYRFDLIDMADYVSFEPNILPQNDLTKGTLATKLDIILNRFEGSVSYFKGYDLLPSLNPGQIPFPPSQDFVLPIIPATFQQTIIGGDFASAIGKTGIRGEIAWRSPKSITTGTLIPNKEWNASLSFDRSFGSLHLIVAWTGKRVSDFIAMDAPDSFDPAILADPDTWPFLESMIGSWFQYTNRILFEQTDEYSHRVLIHPSLNIFHEAVKLEMTGMYNITTGEYMLWPQCNWYPADGLSLAVGYQYYHGEENTRFNWISSLFNGPFLELKLYF